MVLTPNMTMALRGGEYDSIRTPYPELIASGGNPLRGF